MRIWRGGAPVRWPYRRGAAKQCRGCRKNLHRRCPAGGARRPAGHL